MRWQSLARWRLTIDDYSSLVYETHFFCWSSLHSLRSYLSLSSFNNAHRPLFSEIIESAHTPGQRTHAYTFRAKCRLEQQNVAMSFSYPDETKSPYKMIGRKWANTFTCFAIGHRNFKSPLPCIVGLLVGVILHAARSKMYNLRFFLFALHTNEWWQSIILLRFN